MLQGKGLRRRSHTKGRGGKKGKRRKEWVRRVLQKGRGELQSSNPGLLQPSFQAFYLFDAHRARSMMHILMLPGAERKRE